MNPLLCANGCGFYGSAANKDLCSKCYKGYLEENFTKLGDESLKGETFVHEPSTSQKLCAFESFTTDVGSAVDAIAATATASVKNKKNRCKSCSKKVGLTGFECRCGDLFCGRHRYLNQLYYLNTPNTMPSR